MNTNLSTIELELGILRRDHGNSVGLEEIERAARAMAGVPMTTLEELRERLEKAEGPYRELDAEIGNALSQPFKERNVYRRGHYIDSNPVLLRVAKDFPRYTASLDAAIALVEAKDAVNAPMIIRKAIDMCDMAGLDYSAHLARFIVIALLSALIEKEKGE